VTERSKPEDNVEANDFSVNSCSSPFSVAHDTDAHYLARILFPFARTNIAKSFASVWSIRLKPG